MESGDIYQWIRIALVGASLVVAILEATLWAVRKRSVHALGLTLSLIGAAILAVRWVNYDTTQTELVILAGGAQWSGLYLFGALVPMALRRAADSPFRRTTWFTFGVGVIGAFGVWIPGAFMTDRTVAIVEATGQTVYGVIPTPLALGLAGLLFVGISIELYRMARAKFEIARLAWKGLAVSLAFVAVGAVNDILHVLGVIRTVGLVDVGLALTILSVVAVVAANTARAYSELEEDVATKTAKLADTVASLRDLLSGLPDIMLLYRDDEIEIVNARARAVLGDRPLSIEDLGVDPSDREKLRQLFENASDAPKFMRVCLNTTAGPEPVDIVGISVQLEGKESVVANARTTRERDEYERRLRLADRLSSLGTMAAGIAHEINNPISYVSANIEYCLEQLADVPEFRDERDALESSLKGTMRVARIVKDLGTFSRLEDGSEYARADVLRAIDLAVSISKSSIRHRVELDIDVPDELPDARCDAGQLSQVVINLLINASDAMPADRPRSKNRIVLSARRRGDDVLIEVVDNGMGMSPDQIERVFDPFFTTKDVGSGTGLGLSVSHSIIDAAGGRIDVSSAEGEGTTFTVRLPIATAIDGIGEEAPRPVDVGSLAVLLVDDDPMIRRATSRLLGYDHEITSASSAHDAIEVLDDRSFDIILCDVMMPEMNGVEFRTWLTDNRPDLADTFIFFTGGAVGDALLEQVESSNSPVLSKPFDRSSFKDAVMRLRRT